MVDVGSNHGETDLVMVLNGESWLTMFRNACESRLIKVESG